MRTATQLNVEMANASGSFARLCDSLRGADVNIDAVCCSEGKELSIIHMIVSDTETAKHVLQDVGTVTSEEILAFDKQNEKGAIYNIVRPLAGAGVNIRNLYATTHGAGEATVYVVVDDVEKAKTLF